MTWCLKLNAMNPCTLDIPKVFFKCLPVCPTWVCSKQAKYSNCRSEIRAGIEHNVHQAADSNSIRHTDHDLTVLASAFAHGLIHLESWILRRLDGLATFHAELGYNIAHNLGLPHREYSNFKVLFNFESKKVLELTHIRHLKSVAKCLFGFLKHLAGIASQNKVVDI